MFPHFLACFLFSQHVVYVQNCTLHWLFHLKFDFTAGRFGWKKHATVWKIFTVKDIREENCWILQCSSQTFSFKVTCTVYNASQKHESILLHTYVLNEFLTADRSFFPCCVGEGKMAAISKQTCVSQKRVRSYIVLALRNP